MKENVMKKSKDMTIGDLRKAIEVLPDDMHVYSIQELFPNKGIKQLITLRDYQDAGVFNAMPNGFNLYDDNREDDEDGTSLCLNNIYDDVLDCPVVSICSDYDDFDCVCAIFIDASTFKDSEIRALVEKANAEKIKELKERYSGSNS